MKYEWKQEKGNRQGQELRTSGWCSVAAGRAWNNKQLHSTLAPWLWQGPLSPAHSASLHRNEPTASTGALLDWQVHCPCRR